MNHIYRVVFNHVQGVFQAVCERAKGSHGAKADMVIPALEKCYSVCTMHMKYKLLVTALHKLFGISAAAVIFWGTAANAARHISNDETINTPVTENDAIWLDGGNSFTVDIIGGSLNTALGSGEAISIGKDVGTHATVNVNSGGSIYADDKLFVGQGGGAGIVNIGNAGTVTAKNGGNIGAVGGTSGVMRVHNGGQLTSTGYMYIGGDSTGILQVDNGGIVTSNSGFWGVGVNNSGHGTINVEGVMALNGGTSFEIGSAGTGIMNINNGGTVTISGYAWVGPRTGSGSLTVTGAGSKLQTTGTGTFRIGDGSGSGTVLIEQGGNITINGGDVQIGKGDLGSGGTGSLIITGAGSKLESTGTSDLEIGTGVGSTGRITVADNGQLDTNAGQILVGTGASGSLNIGAARGGSALAAGSISQNNTVNLGNNGELVFNHTNTAYVFASPVMGTGVIYQEHAGSTTILSSNNDSFNGSVVINGGALQLGHGGATGSIGSTNIVVGSGAQLKVNRTGALVLSGIISGGGQLQQNGTGTTILMGLNSYSGGTTVTAGTLQGNTSSLQGNITNNANLVFNQTADGTYSGILSGTGTLTKTGSSALTLAADAAAGQVSNNAGALNIDANRTLSITNDLNMASGTTLGVDISSTPAVTANQINLSGNNILNITGYSPVTDTGTYTLATTTSGVTGNFTTTVAGAHLHTYVDLDTYLIGSAWIDSSGNDILARLELVWNNNDPNSAHGTFNIPAGQTFDIGVALADNTTPTALGFGWNGQDLTKTGAGTLILNNINTYTGLTEIQAGTLLIGSTTAHDTAQIAGNIDVQNTATLGGHGRINGTATLNNGATLAPGNSVGTLTVADAIFMNGSTYQVEANPDGTADRLVADSSLGGTGTVTINPGAKLDIIAGAGTWNPSTSYLIIDTDTGVTGQFDTITSNLAFLTETVSYTIPHQVWLTLTRNDVDFGNIGGTENQSETGKGVESLGPGDEIYDQILGMDRSGALNAFDNLSGEIHASTQSALLMNSRYARDAVNRHLSDSTGLPLNEIEARKALWVATWFHDGHLKNDGNAARLDNNGWGVLVGADAYSNGVTTVGVAVGYEQTDLHIGSTRHSDADVNAIHLLGYGRTQAGFIDLKGAIGYSWLDVDTTRNISVGTLTSKNEASYNGNLFQVYIEGSHTFALAENTNLTPYLNLAYQRVQMDSFAEKGDHARLLGHSGSNNLTTSQLGIKGSIQITDRVMLRGDLGWMHNFGSQAASTHLNFIGGAPYQIKGSSLGRDNAVISADTQFQLAPNTNLSIGYEGLFGKQTQDHALKLSLEHRF